MITLKSYVLGQWVGGTGTATVLRNPANGEAVAEASTGGIDFGAVLRHAREVGGPALRAMTFAERGKMLKAMSKALHEQRDPLIEASILNAGTTRSDAKFDIDGAIGTLAYYAGVGEKLGERRYMVEGSGEQLTRSSRFFGYHVALPLRGAAVHINAFNFPAWGLAEKAAVALLAGMPVISKPATATALLTYRVTECLVGAEVMPGGSLQVLCGSTGDLLEQLGEQDVLAFTGSGATGALLRGLQSVIARSVRVNVEADSLNAAVLCADVEAGSDTYTMFVRDMAKEMTQKTGQKCTAVRRIFVPSTLVDRVQADLGEQLAAITVGDPALPEVRMGPLSTAQQLEDVRTGVERLQAAGARVVFGGATTLEGHGYSVTGVEPGKGNFVGPMLLRADSPHEAGAVHEHEVFGPAATLMPYQDADDAAALVARGGGGLVCSVYGDDRTLIESLVLQIAPHHGRVFVGSRKVADQAMAPGMVLPSCVHGGPGRAGGGEELGGQRGMAFYMQRTAVQGDRALLDKVLGAERKDD